MCQHGSRTTQACAEVETNETLPEVYNMHVYGPFETASTSCSCWDSVCFSLTTCVGLVAAVVLQKRALKVCLVPSAFETLEV